MASRGEFAEHMFADIAMGDGNYIHEGASAGALALNATAFGQLRRPGASSGALGIAGTAIASLRVTGAATGALGISGTSVATIRKNGFSAGTIEILADPKGSIFRFATSSGSIGFTISANLQYRTQVDAADSRRFMMSQRHDCLPVANDRIDKRTVHVARESRSIAVSHENRRLAA